MENRTINEEYAIIADKLIKTEKVLQEIAESEATIIYLSSDKEKRTKNKIIYAECERVLDKNKWAIPADYTITVYEPNCREFTKRQLTILLLHELMHIDIKFNDDGTETYTTRDHDYADFKLIIDRYGTDWATTPEDIITTSNVSFMMINMPEKERRKPDAKKEDTRRGRRVQKKDKSES
jgi:uncharacterized protein YwgA